MKKRILISIVIAFILVCFAYLPKAFGQDTTFIEIQEGDALTLPPIMLDAVGVKTIQVLVAYDTSYYDVVNCIVDFADFDVAFKYLSAGLIELNYGASEQKTFNKRIATLEFQNKQAGESAIIIHGVTAYIDDNKTPVENITHDFGIQSSILKKFGTSAHVYFIRII